MPRTSASADSSGKAKSIPVISRQVTRLYEMFWPVIDVINMGKETRPMSADEKKSFKATLPQDQKRVFSLLEKILEEDSTLIERVMRAPREHTAALTRDLKKLLGDGQSNGRSEDMGKVSREMPGWEAMAWDPPLGDKSKRGMFHIQCAELLAPVQYDWVDPKVRNDFRNGVLTATPLQFPRHLWLSNGDFYDPQRPSDGLLQGEILICAAYCIMFSPTSVKTMSASTTQISGARGCSFKRSRGGIIGLAKVYNLTKVTPAFIAYVAVVVHHALTTEAIFSEICGGFNYGVYYNQIRTFLEAPRFASRAKVLLDWWNKRLFGSYNMGMHTLNEGGVSTLDELDAEAEADPGLSGDKRVGSSRQLDEDEEPEE
ncbi:hypothetical protein RhiXN_08132 [Rhizoctonia solani]|uniref:Uncharacterized protein n=1 Tax=Rhizoctonia solani TaxID=456999 RepID=A0A8H8SYD8_9AGAM|nr:uncharacterized protein RhiXN_08132 [Rhizoctonia solani]QRW23096.1 hypothetical protein RhiXN_08132 [Rhizoctonia solani]